MPLAAAAEALPGAPLLLRRLCSASGAGGHQVQVVGAEWRTAMSSAVGCCKTSWLCSALVFAMSSLGAPGAEAGAVAILSYRWLPNRHIPCVQEHVGAPPAVCRALLLPGVVRAAFGAWAVQGLQAAACAAEGGARMPSQRWSLPSKFVYHLHAMSIASLCRLISFNVFTIGALPANSPPGLPGRRFARLAACVSHGSSTSKHPTCPHLGLPSINSQLSKRRPVAEPRHAGPAECVCNNHFLPVGSLLQFTAFQDEDLSLSLRDLLKDGRGRVTVAFELLALVSALSLRTQHALCVQQFHVALIFFMCRWAWRPSYCWRGTILAYGTPSLTAFHPCILA